MNQLVTNEEIDSFMASFIPWGYRDIETALKTYREAGKNDADLQGAIDDFMDSVGTKLEDIDICYVAYDTLQQEARTDIERETGIDISNDSPYSAVNVYGNYMCTDFDGTDEARERTRALIDSMEEKSDVVKWYYNKL